MSRLVLELASKLKMIFGTCFRKLCRKMKTIDEFLQELINEQLEQGILSGNRGEGPSKVKIRPVLVKGQVVYQATETSGTKVFHQNYSLKELIPYLKRSLQNDFSQFQVSGQLLDGTVLVSKKGKATIKTKRHSQQHCLCQSSWERRKYRAR